MTNAEIDYNLLEVEKGNRRYGIYLKNHIQDLQKEIERLNNNINKLEKELEDMATLKTDKYGNTRKITHIDINWLLTKIKELKGVDKE